MLPGLLALHVASDRCVRVSHLWQSFGRGNLTNSIPISNDTRDQDLHPPRSPHEHCSTIVYRKSFQTLRCEYPQQAPLILEHPSGLPALTIRCQRVVSGMPAVHDCCLLPSICRTLCSPSSQDLDLRILSLGVNLVNLVTELSTSYFCEFFRVPNILSADRLALIRFRISQFFYTLFLHVFQ